MLGEENKSQAERASITPEEVTAYHGVPSGYVADSGALFGELMHEHWEHKKKRSGGMSNAQIDAWYTLARDNGAEHRQCVLPDLLGVVLDPAGLRVDLAELALCQRDDATGHVEDGERRGAARAVTEFHDRQDGAGLR